MDLQIIMDLQWAFSFVGQRSLNTQLVKNVLALEECDVAMFRLVGGRNAD